MEGRHGIAVPSAHVGLYAHFVTVRDSKLDYPATFHSTFILNAVCVVNLCIVKNT